MTDKPQLPVGEWRGTKTKFSRFRPTLTQYFVNTDFNVFSSSLTPFMARPEIQSSNPWPKNPLIPNDLLVLKSGCQGNAPADAVQLSRTSLLPREKAAAVFAKAQGHTIVELVL